VSNLGVRERERKKNYINIFKAKKNVLKKSLENTCWFLLICKLLSSEDVKRKGILSSGTLSKKVKKKKGHSVFNLEHRVDVA